MYVMVKFVFWIAVLANFWEQELSFWLSDCSILIAMPLLEVHPSYPLVSLSEGVR